MKRQAYLDLSLHISNLLTNTEILLFWNQSEQHEADIGWNLPQVNREEWRQKY